MSKSVEWYEKNAAGVVERYERHNPEMLHDWLKDLLPSKPSMVLDVGAGTGRDAAWLASMGHEVVAVEPSAAMRDHANKQHPNSPICWFPDKLPNLKGIMRSGLSFDFILLSAVWMHVPKGNDRERAFRKLVSLLKPGGVIAISLRMGPTEKKRGIHPVDPGEIRKLARDHTLVEVYCGERPDHSGRDNINWINIAFRAPDDGTGALPLLRHVILKEAKSSTYKLALLRALCRAADGSAGMATSHESYVSIPLGLVALNWIRLFRPLLDAKLPQGPENKGYKNLGFVKEPFLSLKSESDLNLRVGMSLSDKRGVALHKALRDAARTIKSMPVKHLKHPNGDQMLHIPDRPRLVQPKQVRLEKDYLSSFGEIHVPWHLWQAMQRYDVWIEPALVAEWGRLIKTYAKGRPGKLTDGKIAAAMEWREPNKEVKFPREQALKLLSKGKLYCVWSKARFKEDNFDMDHCLPWSAWPCGDLWNLMPAKQTVNRNQKRELLPSENTLSESRDLILEWWDYAYKEASDDIREQFWIEAHSSLPGSSGVNENLPDIFDALCVQRTRLKLDQQIPEWEARRR